MNTAKLTAKANLYRFLNKSAPDLLQAAIGKNELTEHLIHYTVQHLFPFYKTADEIFTELISILNLFECPIHAGIRSQVAEAMANKAMGTSRRQ